MSKILKYVGWRKDVSGIAAKSLEISFQCLFFFGGGGGLVFFLAFYSIFFF